MTPMAMGLSDQDIADLAVYYASLKPRTGQTRPESLEAGEYLYRAGRHDKGSGGVHGLPRS